MATELLCHDNSATVPALIAQAGGNACFAFKEFFQATLNNPHIRRAHNRIDALVQRHVAPLDSFAFVRGIKHRVVEVKTSEISIAAASR